MLYPSVVDIEITIRNYRCFAGTPVRFPLKRGLQAFVGVNNSGKSCLLRFFYELRSLFRELSQQGQLTQIITNSGPRAFGLPASITDPEELFCDRSSGDIEIGFEFPEDSSEGLSAPLRLVCRIPR